MKEKEILLKDIGNYEVMCESLYADLLGFVSSLVRKVGCVSLDDDSDCTYTYLNGFECEMFTIESVYVDSTCDCVVCGIGGDESCLLSDLSLSELCVLFKCISVSSVLD